MHRYDSSPTSLSSPPSALSEPVSPTRFLNAGRANIEMDEIIVDPGSAPRFGVMQQNQPPPVPDVPLTAAGLPRKKPGRKPGSTVKPKVPPADGSSTNTEPKQRRPRKPRDPNAPPIQRKRKAAATEALDTTPMEIDRPAPTPPATAGRQSKLTELTSMRMSLDAPSEPVFATHKVQKRESGPVSMQNLLNDDPPPKPAAAPARQMFDPIRGNYDPVRETMVSRDPYGTGPLGSPRAPSAATQAQVVNRASASPSIASLVDPPSANIISPVPSHTTPYNSTQARFQEATKSHPPSPSQTHSRPAPPTVSKPPSIVEVKRPAPPPPPPPAVSKQEQTTRTSGFTSMSSIPANTPAAAAASATVASQSNKKINAIVQQDRESSHHSGEGRGRKKGSLTAAAAAAMNSTSSSPKVSSTKNNDLPPLPGNGNDRSILDFGKANPGDEPSAPSIVLHIPLNGETNKYVNFLRMAEERYGWDALHPRLAANRERKARIAAASAALEKSVNGGSGRESADDMEMVDDDLASDGDASNVEMGGMGPGGTNGLSGPDAPPTKPARKKRNFKEDEYDKDDDFVDDSEMLWEEQAAASRDGFFVYSGPLIPEVPKPEERPPARRGRGGGRGSRGGRGGGRGGAAAAEKGEGTTGTTGRGRGGGPGSRGGSTTRKPRITKLEKEQRDREKAERERIALLTAGGGSSTAKATGTSSASSAYGLLQMSPEQSVGV